MGADSLLQPLPSSATEGQRADQYRELATRLHLLLEGGCRVGGGSLLLLEGHYCSLCSADDCQLGLRLPAAFSGGAAKACGHPLACPTCCPVRAEH